MPDSCFASHLEHVDARVDEELTCSSDTVAFIPNARSGALTVSQGRRSLGGGVDDSMVSGDSTLGS